MTPSAGFGDTRVPMPQSAQNTWSGRRARHRSRPGTPKADAAQG